LAEENPRVAEGCRRLARLRPRLYEDKRVVVGFGEKEQNSFPT
jgi:hypothetical protein